MAEIDYDGAAATLIDIGDRRRAGTITAEEASTEVAAVLQYLIPANDIPGLTAEVQDLIARIDGTILGYGVPAGATGEIGSMYINLLTRTMYGPKTLLDGWGTGRPLQGADARNGLAFFAQYNFGPSEIFFVYTATDDTVYDVARSIVNALVAAAAQAVISIEKDGAPWGTLTFNVGQTRAVIDIPDPTQDRGETLVFRGPAVSVPSLQHVDFNFAGAQNP